MSAGKHAVIRWQYSTIVRLFSGGSLFDRGFRVSCGGFTVGDSRVSGVGAVRNGGFSRRSLDYIGIIDVFLENIHSDDNKTEHNRDDRRDLAEHLVDSSALVLAEKRLRAADDGAGELMRLAVLHQDRDDQEDRGDEKNDSEYDIHSVKKPPKNCAAGPR